MAERDGKNGKSDNSPLKPICGIIMPISQIDGCTAAHWVDVREILTQTIENSGFDAQIVSDAEEVGLIHKRIIQNLYDNPIVVCDVSGKNPNVMFELGLRLAFDKPTIIVKDDKTTYSFDTGAIEHLEYPRDLRFNTIVEFKKKLAAKIVATHTKSTTDPTYTTFLKHFGEFTVAKLDKKEVSGQEYILEELKSIHSRLNRLQGRDRQKTGANTLKSLSLCMDGLSITQVNAVIGEVLGLPQVSGYELEFPYDNADHQHLSIKLKPGASENEKNDIEKLVLDMQKKATQKQEINKKTQR